ncbi:MAG: hypothetical protein M0Q49_02435 [Porticoccaceae bacterium]|nr:hypothetical protein [Porticoccaceae bacterium]
MKKAILLAISVTALAGCDPEYDRAYGELRLSIFRECMVLAKDTVQPGHYNDSAEVIQACASNSYYMANAFGSGVGGE